MDKELSKIIEKYKEFKEYLSDIDINDFKKYTRAELKDFIRSLNEVKDFRSLGYELIRITQEKKLEEYPELLGVHNYPEIKEIDFLSEEDKIELDRYLVQLRTNSYIHKRSSAWENLSRKWSEEIEEKVFIFLYNKGIIERSYQYAHCHDYEIMSKETIDLYLKYYDLKKKYYTDKIELTEEEWEEYYDIEENESFTLWCSSCDKETEIEEDKIRKLIDNKSCHIYKVIKERNTFYDSL